MEIAFPAHIGRVPVTIRSHWGMDRYGDRSIGKGVERRVYLVENQAGRRLGVLVQRTGPTTGRYVDPSVDVDDLHLTAKSDWHVALDHELVVVRFKTAVVEEVDGLRFPPAPVVLDDGLSGGWTVGSEVAWVWTWRGGYATVYTGKVLEVKRYGTVVVEGSDGQRLEFMPRNGELLLDWDPDGPRLRSIGDPVFLRHSGRVRYPEYQDVVDEDDGNGPAMCLDRGLYW